MDDPRLQDYVTVLRRRHRVVIVCAGLAVAAALGLSVVQTPTYRAEAELLLRRTTSEELLIDEIGQVRSSSDSERELNNEIRFIESQAVRDAVEEVYDGPLEVDAVSAAAPSSDSNDILEVSAVAADPTAAARLLDVYVDTYLAERRDRQVEDILAASDEIQARLDEIGAQIAEVSRPLDEVEARLASSPPGSTERAQLEDERQQILGEIQPELTPLQSRESTLRGQLEQLEVTRDLSQVGGVEVLAPASVPASPVSPRTAANLAAGGLIGAIVGIAAAFAVEHLDDSIGAKEEAERLTGLPTMGVIPKRQGAAENDLVVVAEPSSAAAEAHRSLRTSVKFLDLDDRVRTILVTSAAASEGKTVTAANLAAVLAQRGDRVLLVGADLRRPRLHDLFGAPQSPGLTNLLLADATVEATTYRVAEVPGLHVMPSGPTPPNPAELLDSGRARDLFTSLAAAYDTVIVDAPPVLAVTDAQVLAASADAVLLVVAHRETSRRGLLRSVELLSQVGAPLAGMVLNVVPPKEAYGRQPYRYETYRSRSERRRRRDRRGKAREPAKGARHVAGNCGSVPEARSLADSAERPGTADGESGVRTVRP